ncbi:YibE/F family protein [Actinomadura kijaniata]|uniref:YibE/F family protein n=1 Tax=Actinomadura kijaniata TaxID=46161 RepID=UPI00082EE7EE|nr:YibE/F family protein [Actinomadura kijaniata]
MGAHHGRVPASPGAVRASLAVVVPLALVTLVALVWMWPSEVKSGGGQSMPRFTGEVVGIELRPCPPPIGAAKSDPRTCGQAHVQLTSGLSKGQVVPVELPNGPGSQVFSTGDDVVLINAGESPDGNPYQLSDHDRSNALWLVGLAFVLAVVAFGRWRGLTALVGLAITFVLLLQFLLPAILDGAPPLLAAIVCASAIMLTVLYLTHGFTVTTSVAVVGTLVSLVLTGAFAWAAMEMAHLSGFVDDSALNLNLGYQISTEGLLLASIIIGSLGVLDDVTVTQAVTVAELAHANPASRFRDLYRAGARVGRAHIASVINTIVLAYAGASLPLLLLFTVGRQPLGEVVTGQIVAQEIVRSVAGTIGLIAAVPVTTVLAALARSRSDATAGRPAEPEPHAAHVH